MTLPITGRRYQIDYMSGFRYVFSPAYRAEVRKNWGQNTGSRLLYLSGAVIGVAVVISAMLLLMLAIQALFR